jgi:hypothetical protein
MAQHQLGRTLKDDEVKALVAFLRTLTADLPKEEFKLAEQEAQRARRGT